MGRVLVLGRDSDSTHMLLHCLVGQGYSVEWFEEKRDDKSKLLARRIKKYGLVTVLGQLLFLLYVKVLRVYSRGRRNDILKKWLGSKRITPSKVVTNINDTDSIGFVSMFPASIILLSGTRILSKSLLSVLKCPVVNIHAGITSRYRGVHGGYWSLVANDPSNFGATIHLVDEGIDTGGVLAFVPATVTNQDNFSTYPLLQQSEALKVLPELLVKVLSGNVKVVVVDTESKLWTHPTLWGYLNKKISRGVQ